MTPFRSILLVVDGSEVSVKAAGYAVDLAAATSVKLVAVSVVDTDTLRNLLSARILVEVEMSEFEADLERSQRRHLDYVQQLARKANIPVETVLCKGVFHGAVLHEQKSRQCDLIILGGFTTTLIRTDVINRQRQQILEQAPCPVLVVK